MALNFPSSPSVGQLYPTTPQNGVPNYKWDGAKWLGTFTGFALTTPAAPTMTWSGVVSDNTPDFSVNLPSGVGDGTDAAVGDLLKLQYSSNGGTTWTDYVRHTLTATDITTDTISATSLVGPLPDGSYIFRGRIERTTTIVSAWTSNVTVTINTAVGGGTGTAPTIDGPWAFGHSEGTTSVTLSGGDLLPTQANDILVAILVTNTLGSATVSTAVEMHTGGSIALTKRKQISYHNTFNSGSTYVNIELWWCLLPVASETVITATLSVAPDEALLCAFAVHGCNTSNPWDTSTSVPATNSSSASGIPTVPGVSILNHGTLGILVAGSSQAGSADVNQTAGTIGGVTATLLGNAYDAQATNYTRLAAQSAGFTAAQSGVSAVFGANWSGWIAIADALTS